MLGRAFGAVTRQTPQVLRRQAWAAVRRQHSEPASAAASAATAAVAPKAPSTGRGPGRAIGSFVFRTVLVLGTGALLVYASDSRAGLHRWVIVPAIHKLTAHDPEEAHEWAVKALALGLAPKDRLADDDVLAIELWGRKLSNPVGLAAGFDKHADAIDPLFGLGFGYVEVGSITPEPQPGNPKPRVFRVPESEALVNRYGFNSEGHDAAVGRLRSRLARFLSRNRFLIPPTFFPSDDDSITSHDVIDDLVSRGNDDALTALCDVLDVPRSLHPGKLLGINLGKNKTSDPDSVDDFVKGVDRLGALADVVVVNVSSPNTPGLRAMQRRGMFDELLTAVIQARDAHIHRPPVLVKVAPDLSEEELRDVAHAVKTAKVDGIIVSNTTISRPKSAGTNLALNETGGLSGRPVKPLALQALATLRKETADTDIVLVGCGGISSGQDALDYAKAGASIVQAYTALVYQGVGLPRAIKDELVAELKKQGTTWQQVVGSGVPKQALEIPDVVPTPAPSTLEAVKADADKAVDKTNQSFSDGLKEARSELEQLLAHLAQAEQEAGTSAASSPEPAATTVVAANETTSQAAVAASTTPSATVGAGAATSSGVLAPSTKETVLDPARAQVERTQKPAAESKPPVSGGSSRWV